MLRGGLQESHSMSTVKATKHGQYYIIQQVFALPANFVLRVNVVKDHLEGLGSQLLDGQSYE